MLSHFCRGFCALVAGSLVAADYTPTSAYQTNLVRGFTVLVNPDALKHEAEMREFRTELDKQFADIHRLLPKEKLATLLPVHIWVEWEKKPNGAAEYHPSANWLRDNGCVNIYADSEQAGQLVTEHLIGLGHTRIGYISSPLDRYSRSAFHLGYLKALALHNIRFLSAYEMIDQQEANQSSEVYEYERGVKLTEQLMAQCPGLTAIIACNDYMALGAIAALQGRGMKLPGQISVVGRDNIPMAQMTTPALTTISEPIREMTQALINILCKPVSAPADAANPGDIVCHGTLFLRDSTAKART